MNLYPFVFGIAIPVDFFFVTKKYRVNSYPCCKSQKNPENFCPVCGTEMWESRQLWRADLFHYITAGDTENKQMSEFAGFKVQRTKESNGKYNFLICVGDLINAAGKDIGCHTSVDLLEVSKGYNKLRQILVDLKLWDESRFGIYTVGWREPVE